MTNLILRLTFTGENASNLAQIMGDIGTVIILTLTGITVHQKAKPKKEKHANHNVHKVKTQLTIGAVLTALGILVRLTCK